MGQVLAECSNMVAIEDIPEDLAQRGPKLTLRINMAPVEKSLGSIRPPYEPGDEVAVVSVEQNVKGWTPLNWRFEQCARQQAAAKGNDPAAPRWPWGSRCGLQRRSYRVETLSADGKGGILQNFCLLQVISDKKERTMENLTVDCADARDAASHAHRFNLHLARTLGGDPNASEAEQSSDVPMVRVVAPVGCFVVGGTAAEIASPGDSVLLIPYPSTEIKKFVFDGGDDFHEIPQGFFHFTACQTGSQQFVCDIQGCEEDDGSFTIVDPLVLRAPKPGALDLLGTVVGGALAPSSAEGPSPERFNLYHPRCGGLCKAFDPTRRSAHQKKHCGMSCG